MKFQVGDKVLVRHSGEEAEVVEIINKEMVQLEVKGVRFPAYMDQLDFPYFKKFTEKKTSPAPKSKTHIDEIPREKFAKKATHPPGLFLSLLPTFYSDSYGDEVVDRFKIHLVNYLGRDLNFSYQFKVGGAADFELQGQIPVGNDFYLHDLDLEKFNDNPTFQVDISLVMPDKLLAKQGTCAWKPRARQIFSKIEEMKKKGHASFTQRLLESYPLKAEPSAMEEFRPRPGQVFEASRSRLHLPPPKYEIDLHIEKLTSDFKGMNNLEMLTLQLDSFEKWLENALAHRQPSLVVIHGVGSGKLRDEIHERLRLQREVKSFVNQYDPRYGYGATEIFFQYK